MLKVDDSVFRRIREYQADEERFQGKALRIALKRGGCSGYEYAYDFTEPSPDDQLFEREGLKVVVDPNSYAFLKDSVIEYVEDDLGGGEFKITNPAAKQSCGCGKSVGF